MSDIYKRIGCLIDLMGDKKVSDVIINSGEMRADIKHPNGFNISWNDNAYMIHFYTLREGEDVATDNSKR